ncbi:MAG: hypothetical protein ACP6IP_09565 [Candidatus Njordarchaeia archaeon]
MPTAIPVRDKKELLELADKMVKYGLAKNRSNAFNIMIEKGINKVREEIRYWNNIHKKAG